MVTQKTVLIIGAAGFVGSHLADRCLRSGYRVIGVDDFSSGLESNLLRAENQARFSFIRGDITAAHEVERMIKSLEKSASVDVVIHLAARKIPRYGNRKETLQVNVLGTIGALRLASRFEAKFVFASTSDVYGLSRQLPFIEDDPVVFGPSTVGRWAYGASKYVGEQLSFGFAEKFSIPVVILRIFGVYGPRQVKGWKGNAVSAFFQQAVEREEFELHGDGLQRRSFLYIDDLVRGMMRAMRTKKADGQVINLGSLESVTMIELAKRIHRVVGRRNEFAVKHVAYQSFTGKEYQDIRTKLPDLCRAKHLLGWEPTTTLSVGLKRTWEWYRNQMESHG